MPRFEASVTVACPSEAVFDFLIRPANAVVITPPEMGLSLIDSPEMLELGSRIHFEIRAYGFSQKFLHEIVAFDPPRGFTEEQVEGVFKRFRHAHQVESLNPSEARIIDQVEFEPPGGLAGFLLTEQRILEALEKSFAVRHQNMKQRLDRLCQTGGEDT